MHGTLLASSSRPFLRSLLSLVLLATLACNGGGYGSPTAPPGGGTGGPPPGGTVSGTGTLRLEMTDAPVDGVTQLVVWVSGLKVKPAGQPTTRIDANLGPYDLLALRGGVTTILADALIDAATYQYIEILLDESQSFVVEKATGLQLPLAIASDKIKLNGGPFEVLKDGTTTVLFDFDAERSLRQRGNGSWLLHPVLEVLEITVLAGT
jgi:hypothetical protein